MHNIFPPPARPLQQHPVDDDDNQEVLPPADVAKRRLGLLFDTAVMVFYVNMYVWSNAIRDLVRYDAKFADGEQLWGALSQDKKDVVSRAFRDSLPEVYQSYLKILDVGGWVDVAHIYRMMVYLRSYKERMINHIDAELLRISQLPHECTLFAYRNDSMEGLFESGAILYHLHAKVLESTFPPRTTTVPTTLDGIYVDDGHILWDALPHEEQVDGYQRFQHSLPPDCQNYLNALAEDGWLDFVHIEKLMVYLRDAKIFIAASIDHLLHVRDDDLDVIDADDDDDVSSASSDNSKSSYGISDE